MWRTPHPPAQTQHTHACMHTGPQLQGAARLSSSVNSLGSGPNSGIIHHGLAGRPGRGTCL